VILLLLLARRDTDLRNVQARNVYEELIRCDAEICETS
jgi:hypothetical protein